MWSRPNPGFRSLLTGSNGVIASTLSTMLFCTSLLTKKPLQFELSLELYLAAEYWSVGE